MEWDAMQCKRPDIALNNRTGSLPFLFVTTNITTVLTTDEHEGEEEVEEEDVIYPLRCTVSLLPTLAFPFFL